MDAWDYDWEFGSFRVHALGGMLGSVRLRLPDGRIVAPFYEAPWLGEDGAQTGDLLDHLRSEFVCLPYAAKYPRQAHEEPGWNVALGRATIADGVREWDCDHPVLGHSAHDAWSLVERTPNGISIGLDYPDGSAIRRLVRTIEADPAAATLRFSIHVAARRPCRMPFGLHPIFALPSEFGAFRVIPSRFRKGFAHPLGASMDGSRAAPGGTFEQLDQVPLGIGGVSAFDALPLPFETEELLILAGCEGEVNLLDTQVGASYSLRWDQERLPSLNLWISNCGPKAAPWDGRNLCLGVEPIAAAFELGVGVSNGPNPISDHGVATTVLFTPEEPFVVNYEITASALPR